MSNTWCVESGRHRKPHLWCVRIDGASVYADHIKTLCGYVVTLTTGIERRAPTCPECRKALRKQREGAAG